MFKLKVVFSAVIIIISGFVIISFLNFNTDLEEVVYTAPVIKITDFSDDAYLYKDVEMKLPLLIKEIDFTRDQGIMTPQQVSLELLFNDVFIEMRPLSHISFTADTKNLTLTTGEFYWNRIKKGDTKVLTADSAYKLHLSGKGRVVLGENGALKLWSYRGKSRVINSTGEFELDAGRLYTLSGNGSIRSEDIPPAPDFISPKKKKIYLSDIKDAVVKLECKSVLSASGYLFRLYGSYLRESVLTEKKTVVNRTSINLIDFENKRNFYWNVFPLNKNETEGEPSDIGRITLFGSTLEDILNKQPPELNIVSLTVNGNLVLIKGNADPTSTLFINEVPVPLEQDGSFIYTKSFKSLGLKTLTFRLVSAAEVENIVTRQITIFEE